MDASAEVPEPTTGPDLVELTVTAERHEHDGVLYRRGDTLRVPPELVRWLEAEGIAR